MPAFKSGNQRGQGAVSILATAGVLASGSVACTLILLVSTNDPTPTILGGAGAFLLAGILVWLLRDRSGQQKIKNNRLLLEFFGSRRKTAAADELVVAKRRTKKPKYGTKAPPTVETVREIKELSSLNTWVPSGKKNGSEYNDHRD
jgi:hypothetical protein